ncbi:MAG: RDD family protein [Spirochaetes bacterium]|nr:RDD family protein [Spirochaetota bacterium]
MSPHVTEYQTSEKIKIDYQLASMPLRFAAFIIDYFFKYLGFIVMYIVMIVILIPSSFFMDNENNIVGIIFLIIFFILIIAVILFYLLYNFIFEFWWKGQTPGKRFLKIRVINDDGTYIGLGSVVLRNIFRIVDFLPVFYITGAITIFVNKKKKRVGDLVAGTIVVREEKIELPEISEPVNDYFAHIQDIQACFTNQELDIIMSYYKSQKDLSEDAKIKIEGPLINIIESKTNVPYSSDIKSQVYINNLIYRLLK